jgi:hypothetical protein
MSIPTYNLGYPQNGSTLGQSKATIRNNLDGTFLTLGVNHYNNNSTNAGKHIYIQIPINGAPSSTGSTELLLFNGSSPIGGALNLYFAPPGQSSIGSSTVTQLTRNEFPIAATNGFSWLPGALLIQWGTATIGGSSGTVSFNTKTISIYNIQITLIGSSSSTNTLSIVSKTPGTPGSFTWHFTGSSSYSSFYWMAIGT